MTKDFVSDACGARGKEGKKEAMGAWRKRQTSFLKRTALAAGLAETKPPKRYRRGALSFVTALDNQATRV